MFFSNLKKIFMPTNYTNLPPENNNEYLCFLCILCQSKNSILEDIVYLQI